MPWSPKSTAEVKSQKSQARSGSSRRNRTISRYRSGETVITEWPRWSSKARTSSPNCARSRDSTSGGGSGRREVATPLLLDVLVRDLLLEPDDPVQQALRPRGASRDVHIDRDDLVNPLGHRVGVPVRAPAV